MVLSRSLSTSPQGALLPRVLSSVLSWFSSRFFSRFFPPRCRYTFLPKRAEDRPGSLTRTSSSRRRNSTTMSTNMLVRICGPKLLRSVKMAKQEPWITVSRCFRLVESPVGLIETRREIVKDLIYF